MALRLLVVLALAQWGRSWPQLSLDDESLDGRAALPEIPFTTHRDGLSARNLELPKIEEDGIRTTLPVPISWKKRQVRPRKMLLPVDDALDVPLMTLPVPLDREGWTWKGSSGKREAAVQEEEVVETEAAEVLIPRSKLAPRQVPGALALPVVHSTKPGIFKRAIEVQLANRSDVAYYAQINIGTPPQEVFVQVDTGSFELWVNPDCTVLPEGDRRFCEAVGSYDAESSTTASEFSGSKVLRYGIGAANITYVRDSVGLPGSGVMSGVQFGVATSSEDQFAGILGIGYGEGITTRYPNFVDNLKAQGLTRTRSFSLAMGSKDDQEGVLVFGGVDTGKFGGPLARLPVIPAAESPDGVPRYWVQMDGMALTPPSGGTAGGASRPYPASAMPVFLDSGATLTLLPQPLADAIARDFGSTGVDSSGFYAVDCSLVDMAGSVDFVFPGITIKVPYKEIIRELNTSPPRCYLGIVPNEDFVLLGDTFLRSAYVVFDPEDHLIYMAEYANCGTNVLAVDDVSMLPTLTGDCAVTQNAVVPTTGGSAGVGSSNTNQAADGRGNRQTGTITSAEDGIDSEGARMAASWLSLLAVAGLMFLF